MKILDWEKKGNLVRLYLGNDDIEKWWGDDWNDAPWDCNAGPVYEQYVAGIKDIVFPLSYLVLEPVYNYDSTVQYSKEDLMKRHAPFLIVAPPNIRKESYIDSFDYWVGNDNVCKFYLGDSIETKLDGEIEVWEIE